MFFSPQNATLNPNPETSDRDRQKHVHSWRVLSAAFPGNFNVVRRFRLGIGFGVVYIPGKGLHRPH